MGQVLYEPGTQMQHACFPTTAVVSLHYVTVTGASAQTASVGREGVVGIALFMGGDTTTSSAVVQTAGQGYRLCRSALVRAFEQEGQLRPQLLRYTQALLNALGLVSCACECYSVVRGEQQRLQAAGQLAARAWPAAA